MAAPLKSLSRNMLAAREKRLSDDKTQNDMEDKTQDDREVEIQLGN